MCKRYFYLVLSLLWGLSVVLFAQDWQELMKKEGANYFEIRDAFYKAVEGKSLKDMPGYKHFRRWQLFVEPRVDETGHIPKNALWNAWKEKQLRFGQGVIGDWTCLGPKKRIAPTTYWSGQGVGRVNSITLNPLNPRTIYICAGTGGVWRGKFNANYNNFANMHWTPITDGLPTLGASYLVINPTDTLTMYFASGDNDPSPGGGFDSTAAAYSKGIFKTTDGGVHWDTLKAPKIHWQEDEMRRIGKLMIHPTNNQILIAVGRGHDKKGGIWKTTDAGATWNEANIWDDDNMTIPATGWFWFRDLEVDPKDPTIWYAANFFHGIYKSTDTGENWVRINDLNGNLPQPLPADSSFRIELGVSAASLGGSPDPTIYALYTRYSKKNSKNRLARGLYRSSDRGKHWTIQTTENYFLTTLHGFPHVGQGEYNLVLEVHPDNADLVYMGLQDLFRSTDGGSSFNKIAGYSQQVHPDFHGFAFHPDHPDTIIAAHDGGLDMSFDGGNNWHGIDEGLSLQQFLGIGGHPKTADIVYGGAQDNGVSQYKFGCWKAVSSCDGAECLVVNNKIKEPDSAFYLINGDFAKTTGFGYMGGLPSHSYLCGKESIPKDVMFGVLKFDFTNKILYRGTNNGVYKSTDYGESWNTTDGNPDWNTNNSAMKCRDISVLAVSASHSDTLYAFSPDREGNNVFFRTGDGGLNWKVVYNGGDDFNTPKRINSMAIHPTDPRTAWITYPGYTDGQKVWRTTDAGANWQNISGNLVNVHVNSIVVNPKKPEEIYIGTDLGVFYSDNGLTGTPQNIHWMDFGNGMPDLIVTELELHRQSMKLRAATYGRGLWETPLATQTITKAPRGARALSYYDHSINLYWYPPEGYDPIYPSSKNQYLKYYRIWRATGSSSFQLLADHVDRQYYIDRNVINNTVYAYKIEAYFENYGFGEASRIAIAKAGNPFSASTVISPWTDNPPNIDGSISVGEWDEAVRVWLTLDETNRQPVFAKLMNDANKLYIAIEDGNLDPNEVGHQIYLGYDLNLDGEWPFTSPSNEGVFFGILNQSSVIQDGLIKLKGLWPDVTKDGLTQTAGITYNATLNGTVQHEMAIDMSASDFQVPLGSSAGFLMHSLLSTITPPSALPSTSTTGLWPYGAQSTDIIPQGYEGMPAFVLGQIRLSDQGVQTNIGSNVTVAPNSAITVTFSNITASGLTNAYTSVAGPVVPSNFALGENPLYYDIISTASYDPPITISITYNEAAFVNENKIRILHYEGNQFVDRTLSLDVVNNVITAQVNSLSEFVIAETDNTTPAYEFVGLNTGPPMYVEFDITDHLGGLSTIEALKLANCVLLVPNDSRDTVKLAGQKVFFSPSTIDSVRLRAVKIKQNKGASIIVKVTDGAGNYLICDPVYTIFSSTVPLTFNLQQNYPNPFNPTTTIHFDVAEAHNEAIRIKIKIYDVLGREVRTLINKKMKPGHYSIYWDSKNNRGQNVASGLYFCRMIAGNHSAGSTKGQAYSATKKMILLK